MLVVLVAGLTAVWAQWRRSQHPPGLVSREKALVFLGFWIAGAITATYVAALSPRHAMAARYLSSAWPFIAFLPVLFWRALPEWRTALASVGAIALVASVVASATFYLPARPSPAPALGTANAVVFDNLAPGMLPRTVWHVPAPTPAYAGAQPSLRQESIWRAHPRTVLVSQATFGSSVGGRRQLLRYLQPLGSVRPVPSAFQPHTEIYRFEATGQAG